MLLKGNELVIQQASFVTLSQKKQCLYTNVTNTCW